MIARSRIDAHMHYMADTAESRILLEKLDLKMMNICVAEGEHGKWRDQAEIYGKLSSEYPDRFAWCTSFDLPRFDDPRYVEAVIERLGLDFDNGAVACKVWKNFGMGVRNPLGKHVLPDDDLLMPVYEFIAERDKTLLMHIADPIDGWLPLSEGSPHHGYFSKHPEWHLYGRQDMPCYEELIAARDFVVERNPTLRVVGAHLGSMEHDVNEVAKRLDRFPNFAVDISARLYDIAVQDVATVRSFMEKYQDRVLFGIDCGTWGLASEKGAEKLYGTIGYITREYTDYCDYLEGDGSITLRDLTLPALNLPEAVLGKIYIQNAQNWYPGL